MLEFRWISCFLTRHALVVAVVALGLALALQHGGAWGSSGVAQPDPQGFPAAPLLPRDQSRQTKSMPYAGMNLLFIVDQSGSMGGVPYGGPADWANGNDPDGFRFEGPIYALDWLDSYVSTLTLPRGQEPPLMNMAVLAFGTNARLILDWTAIGQDQNKASWQTLKSDIASDISYTRFRPDPSRSGYNLGDTNFLDAFATARSLFQHAPSPAGGKHYLNAIVILTDGGPCAPPNACTVAQGLAHLNALAGDVRSYFPRHEIYLVGIDSTDGYWTTYADAWGDVVCGPGATCDASHLLRVITLNELVAHFNEILVGLANEVVPGSIGSAAVPIPPGEFSVPPYQQLLRLNVFKTKPGQLPGGAINLYHENNLVTPSVLSGPSAPIERYEVEAPAPGTWRIDVPDADAVKAVTFVTNLMAVGLRGEITTPQPVEYQAVDFRLDVVDRNDQTIARYPNNEYPLTFEVAVYDARDPDKENRPQIAALVVSDDPAAPDAFSYTGTWRPMEAGTYEVRASAFYTDSNTQQPVYLFEGLSAVDPLVVGETFFEHQGISSAGQPVTSVRENEDLTLTTLVKDKATGAVVAWDTSHLVMELQVLSASTQTPVMQPQHFSSAAIPGVIEGAMQVGIPGDYVFLTRAGMMDDQQQFVPLEDFGSAFPLTVRPLHPLVLELMVIPGNEAVDAQRPGPFPRPWSKTPVTVQIQLRDQITGQLASLQYVTGGSETLPTLKLEHNGRVDDLTDRLMESLPGRYVTVLDDLGMGDFTFSAQSQTPADQLANGDFVWQAASARFVQERRLALFIPLAIGIALAVLGLLIVSTVMYRQFVIRRREAPLRGTLDIVAIDPATNEPELYATVELTHYSRNRLTLGEGQLKAPLELIEISTRRDSTISEEGALYVERVKAGGKPIAANLPVRLGIGDEVFLLTDDNGVEYYVAKDMAGVLGSGLVETVISLAEL